MRLGCLIVLLVYLGYLCNVVLFVWVVALVVLRVDVTSLFVGFGILRVFGFVLRFALNKLLCCFACLCLGVICV